MIIVLANLERKQILFKMYITLSLKETPGYTKQYFSLLNPDPSDKISTKIYNKNICFQNTNLMLRLRKKKGTPMIFFGGASNTNVLFGNSV